LKRIRILASLVRMCSADHFDEVTVFLWTSLPDAFPFLVLELESRSFGCSLLFRPSLRRLRVRSAAASAGGPGECTAAPSRDLTS